VKYVIEEIARLDAQAFENEQKNKSALFQQRQKYENEMKKYREHKIKEAEESAKTAYDRVIDKAQSEYREKEAEMKQKAELLEKRYLKAEKAVLDSVFDKLFTILG
jgi:NAD dependent epimerase/dehydratase family enzyme